MGGKEWVFMGMSVPVSIGGKSLGPGEGALLHCNTSRSRPPVRLAQPDIPS